MIQNLLQIDGNALLWIQENLRNPVLTPLMKAFSIMGNHGAVWILLTLLLLFFPKTRKAGIISAMALIGSLLINNIILKPLIARTRPYEIIQGLEILVAREHDFSFPSGHSGASFASAWSLRREIPKPWNIILILIALMISLSRLYVGVHFPTDVCAGILTGILAGEIAGKLFSAIEDRLKKPSQL